MTAEPDALRLVPVEPTEAMERRRDGCRSEAERSAYAEGLSDAAQRARYLAKRQEWEDCDGGPNSRRDGFEMSCEVLNELLEEASSVAALKPLAAAPAPATARGGDDIAEFLSEWFERIPGFEDTGNGTIKGRYPTGFSDVEFDHIALGSDLAAALASQPQADK